MAAELAVRQERDRIERERKDGLSMWERIEESDASEDVKDILHRLAQRVEMES